MPRAFGFLLLLTVLFSIPAHLIAQPPPGPDEEPTAFDPYPGAALEEDPGSSLDPTLLDYVSTLGQPQEAYDGDPSLLDWPDLYPPELVGTGPSVGSTYDDFAVTATPDCKTFPRTGRSVIPIGVSGSNPRYLSYRGKSSVYLGWSADAACHFKTNNPDNCHSGLELPPPQTSIPPNYAAVLTALRSSVAPALPRLRKLRLWVTLSGEDRPANVPFAAVGDPAAGGYWRLDLSNQDYFNRLREVVNKARQLDLQVEITFFAPFQGKKFSTGPWSYAANRAKALKGAALERVGFSEKGYFAVLDKHTDTNAAHNLRMRDFQANVIRWTIDELWCYENVWYEIANEPEDQTVEPVAVAEWSKTMIDQVEKVEKDYVKDPAHLTRSLQRRHLIAVQPWTDLGAVPAFLDPRISIVSSHYTTVSTDSAPTLPNQEMRQLDLGAITLARKYADKMRILGFNETKITPLRGPSGDRSHLNGVLQSAPRTEGTRAEALEFLLSQGGTYDNWSYNSADGVVSPATGQVRNQLGNVQAYFDGLPLDDLTMTTPKPPKSWVTNISKYPENRTLPWESSTSSRRYWAGLQTPDRTGGRMFVLYQHHSTPRCHSSSASNTETEYGATGCFGSTDQNPLFLSFGGYDARIWTQASKRYHDSFTVNLGTSPGKFIVRWKDPKDLTALVPLKEQVVFWKQAATGSCTSPACIVCSNPAVCTLESPLYDFDIVLEVKQQP